MIHFEIAEALFVAQGCAVHTAQKSAIYAFQRCRHLLTSVCSHRTPTADHEFILAEGLLVLKQDRVEA